MAQKKKSKSRKNKIIIVVYLAGYDSKVRMEEEVDSDLTKKELAEIRKRLKQKLIKDFGQYWSGYRRRQVKLSRTVNVKAHRQHIVLKGKDLGFMDIKGYNKIVSAWNLRQEAKALLLRQQGYTYNHIAKDLGRTSESVRSKILRLQGSKNK